MDLKSDIEAGLALLPSRFTSNAARIQLYATSRQENPDRHPRQLIKKGGILVPEGPAAGDYQFEKGGGVIGVLTHATVKQLTAQVCRTRGVAPTVDGIYAAIQADAPLAAALARLLYWTDPKPLPVAGDSEGAFALYLRTWRPGAYARQPEELIAKWANRSYPEAMKAYGRL